MSVSQSLMMVSVRIFIIIIKKDFKIAISMDSHQDGQEDYYQKDSDDGY